ncbi:DUF4439 domain-containing protein [Demequina pelophila]|uniref:DUF4439 domain-containing protein n=1 Tax=Demequina pelophila TaxID=1638984 RepID=UPI001D0E4E55|nr:DUF4439 domain-containing protein [Demequina pelophila]
MTAVTRLRRPAALMAVAALLAGGATGCSLRLETPPIPLRTPSPEVQVRDAAALREQAVIDAAAAATGTLAELESATAPERLAALGGIYVEYPDSTPEVPSAALAEAVLAATQGALDAALETDDASLAALLRSIALGHALALDAAGLTGPGGEPVPNADTAVPGTTLAELARAHYALAFAYEAIAAAAEEDERQDALASQALHRDRGDALAAAAGETGLRAQLYDVPADALTDAEARAAYAAGLERDLGDAYTRLAIEAASEDVDWLLAAAVEAAGRAADRAGGTSEVPALPGLAGA